MLKVSIRSILHEKCFKKLILIMKLNLILLILGTFSAMASSYSQSTRVNVSVEEGTIIDIFNQIEKQSEFRIFYRLDEIDLEKKYTVNYNQEQVGNMLADILKGSNTTYELVDKVIVIEEARQQLKVSGTVTDASTGLSLPGVNILIEGTQNGTTTDVNGRYSLEVSAEKGVLIFSYIGYVSATVEVNARSAIDIALEPDYLLLEEVVVIGYGSMKKKDVTGSVASVQSTEFEHQQITTPEQILKGRVAGVAVTQTSGAPGGDYKIRIRGANSILGGNDPLLVVDGIQGGSSLQDINPNDIESIDILKDASSTAIYGSRGANGVILITTKSGLEGPAVVELNTYLSFKNAHNPYEMMDPVLYAETVNLSSGGAAYSQDDIDELRRSGGTNAYEDLLQQGLLQSYEVSVRGGSKLTKYSISAGVNSEDGVLVNTKLKRYMFRSNLSTQITDKLSVGLNLTAAQNKGRNISSAYSETTAALCWAPAESIKKADGTWQLADPYGYYLSNPVMLLNEMNRDFVTTTGLVAANLKYEIFKGLTFQSNAGLNADYGNRGYYNNEIFAFSGSVGGRTGSGQSSSTSSFWQLSNTLTYTKTINDAHSLSLMAGVEASKYAGSSFSADGTVMATTSVGYDNLSMNTNKNIGSSYSSSALNSYFARANYAFKDRYLITGTFRADGSSKFKGDNKFSYFPSVGLGWRISEEEFMSNQRLFDNLKLRASWGKTGNQAIGPYGTMSLLTGSNYHYGSSTLYPGYKPYGSSNPDLKWEVTTQQDLGLDASFLKGRLNISIDVYNKLTSGLLQAVALPNYNGGGTVYQNIGEIENKGIEFLLNAVPVQSSKWRWDAGFNISYAKNNVTSVGDEEMIFPGGNYSESGGQKWFVVMPGEPLGTFYGYKWLGIWRNAEATEAARYGAKPGDNKFEDINNDGSIDGLDNQVIGHGVAPWRMGFNTTVSYKDFSLNALIEGAFGGETYNFNYSMAAVMTSEGRTVTLADGADYWTPENDDAKFANILSDTYNAFRNTSQWLENGSYIKFRNLSLSYNLSKQKVKFANIKLFVSGQNILTITKYKGDDPEVTSTGGSDIDVGLDHGVYPSVKTYTAGVTITF